MFIEPADFEAMPMVSNAETMLSYVNPARSRETQTDCCANANVAGDASSLKQSD